MTAADGNSLQDKQWTPTGAGTMVPEEEEVYIHGKRYRAKSKLNSRSNKKIIIGRTEKPGWNVYDIH